MPIFYLVRGATAPLELQLYPADTDTGSNGLDLTGATAFSAKARRLDDNGPILSFSSVVVASAVVGKVKLQVASSMFPEAGLYKAQITYTAADGSKHIVPSDGDSFRLAVYEAIG